MDVPLNKTGNAKETAFQVGTFLSNSPDSDTVSSMVTGIATAKANQEIQDWLGKFGTARVSLSADKNFSLKDSSLEMLLPLYDTQANLGPGWHHFAGNDWMAGSNLFLGHDLSRSHFRIGIGAEYWRDFLKLGANGYVVLTGWRSPPDVEDYEERPANGWDIRAEGYLPAYSQLSTKLMYEQYYGNDVGLFGKDDRQKKNARLYGRFELLSTPRLLAVLGMRTISWTALSFQPALLVVHFGADGTQR